MEISVIHWVCLALTILGVIVAGILYAGRQTGAAGFSLAGRKSGPVMIAGAFAGSALGGAATVGTATTAAYDGMVACYFTLGMGLGMILMGLFYARKLRESNLETVPQFLALNFGKSAGPIVSIITCFGIFFACSSSMLPGSHMICSLAGVPPVAAAGILVLLMVAYITFGGQKGSSFSGVLKTAVLWTALLAAACIAVYHYRGGESLWGGLSAMFEEKGVFSKGGTYGFSYIAATVVGTVTAQMYIQGLFSASNARTAARGAYLGALFTIPVGYMACAIGMYMGAHHPEMLATPAQASLVLPAFLLDSALVPQWLGGIALGGIVLCIISSAAVQALAISTMFSRDIVGDLMGVKDDRRIMMTNRIGLAVAAILVAVFCLVNWQGSSLWLNYLSMALRGGGTFLPLTLAIFFGSGICRHVSRRWVLASLVLSTLSALASLPVPQESALVQGMSAALGITAKDIHDMLPVISGLVVSAAVLLPGWLCTALCRRNDDKAAS